ncbi:unnamed protein product [Ilex paraguariensis]|uniref:Uncharacterized protein n=1 Tax=Ilex paraguariensis TaxID=185542 RepID=A0ABC8S0K5_9AQUA
MGNGLLGGSAISINEECAEQNLRNHLYVCLKGVGVSLDDERGLRFVKEPPNKGFKSDDDLFAGVDWEHSDSKSSDAEVEPECM